MKGWGFLFLIIGIILIGYGMSQAGDFDNENHYLLMRGSIIFGLLLSIIGGYILLPKEKMKYQS